MRSYCTYFDRNYLIKAIALVESLNQHEKDFQIFAICCDELSRTLIEHLQLPHVIPVPLHAIEEGEEELLAARSTRSLVEYYWTLTPVVLQKILEWNPDIELLTYLDSDLYFFSSPDPVFEELGDKSVLIHEHRYSPDLVYLEKESGIYNVGLLCFRRDALGMEVLQWWRDRCIEWCYARHENGKMGDQMYLNDWATRFSSVHVLQHIGAGVAGWNHIQYHFTEQNGKVMLNDIPLVFYHFHSFQFVNPDIIIPAKHAVYRLTQTILSLCFLPYIKSLMRGIEQVRRVLPEFSFGLISHGLLSKDITFLAKKSIAGQIQKTGVSQIPVSLDQQWNCYCSAQMTDSKAPSVSVSSVPVYNFPAVENIQMSAPVPFAQDREALETEIIDTCLSLAVQAMHQSDMQRAKELLQEAFVHAQHTFVHRRKKAAVYRAYAKYYQLQGKMRRSLRAVVQSWYVRLVRS